jgi:hypothetical protein
VPKPGRKEEGKATATATSDLIPVDVLQDTRPPEPLPADLFSLGPAIASAPVPPQAPNQNSPPQNQAQTVGLGGVNTTAQSSPSPFALMQADVKANVGAKAAPADLFSAQFEFGAGESGRGPEEKKKSLLDDDLDLFGGISGCKACFSLVATPPARGDLASAAKTVPHQLPQTPFQFQSQSQSQSQSQRVAPAEAPRITGTLFSNLPQATATTTTVQISMPKPEPAPQTGSIRAMQAQPGQASKPFNFDTSEFPF